MDFGTILKSDCVNQPPQADPQCADPAYAFANPTMCPAVPKLLLKPGSSIVCLLGSMQFRAFSVVNGIETDVSDSAVFTVSDPTAVVIGAASGNATGIQSGDVIVTATYQGLTATADLTVLGSGNCCEEQTVAFMLMIDDSLSMSQKFGGSYNTKLDFAKFAAEEFINSIDATKDKIGLMMFDGFSNTVLVAPTHDKASVIAALPQVLQTNQSTSFFDALSAAADAANNASVDRPVIVLISDGQDETAATYSVKNPVAVSEAFKAGTGSIISFGVRASGTGYALLNAVCSGGFFVNSYPGVESDAITLFEGLKGYLCGGNCAPPGDEFVATGALNYTGWANWTGQADLLGNGFIDLLPGNGLYVDLSSATAPYSASLVSKATFNVTSGKTYRLTLSLAGNQRVALASNVTIKISSASVDYVNQTLSIPDYAQNFTPYSFTFTPQADDVVTIEIDGAGSDTMAVAGPLMDSVVFENATDLVTILDDDFDSENQTYVPPQCGQGTVYNGYGYSYGYNCYSTGCLDSNPPPAQLQDPDGLPDIEGGFTPPQTFISTKTACVVCPNGFSNILPSSVLTGDSATSTVTASSAATPDLPTINGVWETTAALPQWVQWKFNSAQIVTLYSIQNVVGDILANSPFKSPSPASWTLQGSNDGTTWTTLDSQDNISWPTTQVTKQFPVSNTTAYTYYRLNFTAADGPAFPIGGALGTIYLQVNAVSMSGQTPQQACATATATSTISQSDADAKAIAAAQQQGYSMLNCQKIFSSTQTYTAHCPAGLLGNPVVKSATAESFVSQADADAKALAAAQAGAESALSCDGDNHNQAITILDNSPASPYPSVKFVSGLTGAITKVTVTVKNFSHQSPSDVQMVLRSPAGTYVQLMLGCGGPLGANPVTDLTFVFDDSGSAMPESSILTSGTFAPTQFGPTPNLPAPAAVAPYQSALASLIGEDPNGSWSLWIVDKQPLQTGSIAGVPAFDVTITSA